MNETSFSCATLPQRLAALFSADPWSALPTHSDLVLAEGRIAGRNVLVVATDPATLLGTFGICECDDFQWALQRARATGAPLVLLLDSAGARLNAGLPIQGALRSLMRAVLDARFDQVPMLAVLGRYAFGAASMLAGAASQRLQSANTLIAMSGPKVLAAQANSDLDPKELHQHIKSHLNGHARSAASEEDVLIDDTLTDYAFAVRAWLEAPLAPAINAESLQAERERLQARLQASALAEMSPGLQVSGRFSWRSGPFGAVDALALCKRLEQEIAAMPTLPLTLAMDSPGHSVDLRDEQVFLTQYLVHLAMFLRYQTRNGVDVGLLIERQISGGVYIALAAGATRTELASDAMVRTLPASALMQILGDDTPETPDGAAHLEWGVVDLVRPTVQDNQRDADALTLA